MADFEEPARGYEGTFTISLSRSPQADNPDDRGYERRERSASPRGDREEAVRSRSPNGRDRP